ncbi:GH25 family lysozyme [Psychromicrobium sp. YIM B11713]|uniref:GH25 family lysozyme n=1 Tax=Psychromicrobium sp. YIM B11713 TaxID=3145233 RepID=UPI00374ED038
MKPTIFPIGAIVTALVVTMLSGVQMATAETTNSPGAPSSPPSALGQQVQIAPDSVGPDGKPKNAGAVMGGAGKISSSNNQSPRLAPAKNAPELAPKASPTVPEQPSGTQGRPLGLDVSGWQVNVNWATVKKNGAQFAYIKASEGMWALNDQFAQQYNGSAANGLLRGAYHFARPNLSSGAEQARVMIAAGGGWTADGITLPGALDLEDNPYSGANRCYNMTPTQLANWAKDFSDTYLAATNKYPVLYTGYYFWQDCLGGSAMLSTSSPLWIAAYYASSPLLPGGWNQYSFWQYANQYSDSSQTTYATFPGDQNVFNGSLDQLRKIVTTPDLSALNMPSGAIPISGKWTGDGKTYPGWVKDAYWCLQTSLVSKKCFYFGVASDKPVVGDWDGDGRTTIGIVRNAVWQLSNNVDKLTVDRVQSYGIGSDTPITGDWNGDGKTDIGIFRGGSWQITSSSAARPPVQTSTNFGIATDVPVIGDWNSDKKDTFGIWRSGTFWLTNSLNTVDRYFGYGLKSDTPVTGDWDGNGSDTVGIVRGAVWQLTNNLSTLTVDQIWK